MVNGLGEVTRVVGTVEKMVTENLGFIGVHNGFSDAYESIRSDLMRIVAKELLENPADLYFTGHSLGGELRRRVLGTTMGISDIFVHEVFAIDFYINSNAINTISNYTHFDLRRRPRSQSRQLSAGTHGEAD